MNVCGDTNIGKVRETNQDKVFVRAIDEQSCFAVVCDGMGGQSGGHIASGMTCDIIAALIDEDIATAASDEEIKQMMINAVSKANIQVYKASNIQSGCKGMGTTAVAVVIKNKKAHIIHIGDSRVYFFNEASLKQVTKDHSLVQELLEQGKITKEEAPNHPNKNMITRAVGVNMQVDIDYLEFPFIENSKLLLCTDGLTNMISDEIIEKTLNKYHTPKVCEKLIELANKAGGIDNTTVAVID